VVFKVKAVLNNPARFLMCSPGKKFVLVQGAETFFWFALPSYNDCPTTVVHHLQSIILSLTAPSFLLIIL